MLKGLHPAGQRPKAFIYSVFPYVGIIQIRLWVETSQFPLSQLQPAPLFHIFYATIIQPITGYDKKKFEPLFIKNGHRPDIEKDFDL